LQRSPHAIQQNQKNSKINISLALIPCFCYNRGNLINTRT
jgi:hypothetical protein